MEIKKRLAAVLFLLVLGLPMMGFSEENWKPYYVDLTSGYFIYTQEDKDDVNNGPAFGIGLGYRPAPSLGLEISYLGSRSSAKGFHGSVDVGTNLFTIGGRLSGWLGARGAAKNNHEFFVQGGLGGGFVSASAGGASVSEGGFATRLGFGYLYHGNRFAIGPSIAISTLRQEEAASLFVSPLFTLTAAF